MSLIFFKNNKPDNRLSEYEREIVRLGLEKEEKNRDVEKIKKDLAQLSIAYDLVRSTFIKKWEKLTEEEKKEIGDKITTLSSFDKKIEEVKNNLCLLSKKQKDKENELNLFTEESSRLLFSIQKGKKDILDIENNIKNISKEKSIKEKEIFTVRNLLESLENKKDKELNQSLSLGEEKNKLEKEIGESKKILFELNEIISVLQTSNKNGLNLVASFEGERKRLNDKELFLKRKEEDLLLYEKRIEKRAKELGVNIKMIFE